MHREAEYLTTGFYGTSTTFGNSFILEGTLDICKLLRKSESQLVEMSQLRGNAASNPTEGYFLEIGLFSFSSNPGAITVVTDIEYDAVFTEPVANYGDS